MDTETTDIVENMSSGFMDSLIDRLLNNDKADKNFVFTYIKKGKKYLTEEQIKLLKDNGYDIA